MKISYLKILTVVPYVLIWQVSFILHLDRLVTVAILLFPVIFLRRRDVRLNRIPIYAIILSIFFIFMLIEPAVAYGKAALQFSSYDLLHNMLYAFLFPLSMISLLHGVILKPLWKKPFAGMSLTAAVYVLSVTPASLFLDASGLASLLLFNISFLVVMSYYIGFLYLKSDFNILSSYLFLTVYSVFLIMNVSVTVSKLFNLVWEVISLSVMLFLTDRIIKGSLRINRVFRYRKKLYRKKEKSTLVLFAGIMILLVMLVVLPVLTQESHYVIADPTDSMYPVIQPGSLLFVTHENASQVKVGSVIVFNAPWESGTLYAHQVINITHQKGVEYFVTKGVNNPAKDPLPVPSGDLVGKVYFALPYAGYLLIYSKVTAAIILVVVGIFYFKDSRS